MVGGGWVWWMVGGGWVWWMVGGGWVWWTAARSLPEMAEYRQKMKLPPSVSCFKQVPQEPTTLLPAYQVYRCRYCCTAVCSRGLVGGWVEDALRRPWWVGGPFRTWESFFVLWEINLCLFLTFRPPTGGAWEDHLPHCCTPLSFMIYM